MRSLRRAALLALPAILLLALPADDAGAKLTPSTLTKSSKPGASFTEKKTLTFPAVVGAADVIFGFDLTGSMGGILSTAKARAIDIMNKLNATGTDIRWAVMSHADYPARYSSCGYTSTYGASGTDFPYKLGVAFTKSASAVQSAINAMRLRNGYDGPESYSRLLYESYAEPALKFRTGAKRVLLAFGDNLPHDCNVNEGVPGVTGTKSTGKDPGRDAKVNTSDDLDVQTVLSEMRKRNVVLLSAQTSSSYSKYWTRWAAITGGKMFLTNSSKMVEDIVSEIKKQLVTKDLVQHVKMVVTTKGYEGWLTKSVPASYSGTTKNPVNFTLTFTVPKTAKGGKHTFTVQAIDILGVSHGSQTVTVTLPEVGGRDAGVRPDAGGTVKKVRLLSLVAERVDAGVRLSWRTGSETECGAFRILRAEGRATPSATEQIIGDAPLVTCKDSLSGASYAVVDPTARAGVSYSYVLREYETTGRENDYGPVYLDKAAGSASWRGSDAPSRSGGASLGGEAGPGACAVGGSGAAPGLLLSLIALGLLVSRRRR